METIEAVVAKSKLLQLNSWLHHQINSKGQNFRLRKLWMTGSNYYVRLEELIVVEVAAVDLPVASIILPSQPFVMVIMMIMANFANEPVVD